MTTGRTKGAGQEELREKLRQYRLERARSDKVPPYFVFWNSSLVKLCEELPRDDEALSNIPRFGGQETRDKYGEDVLKIIDDWAEERLEQGLPLQQGELRLKDSPRHFAGGMLGESPWTLILGELYESFCGTDSKVTKKHIGQRTGCKRANVNSVLSRMKELDFFDEDAFREGRYTLDPTKPKVGSLIFALAELEGGHRSQEVQHRIEHLMKHRRCPEPDILVKIGDREIEMDAKKLIGFSSQIDSAIQKELPEGFEFDEHDGMIISRFESSQEMKDKLNKTRDFNSQMKLFNESTREKKPYEWFAEKRTLKGIDGGASELALMLGKNKYPNQKEIEKVMNNLDRLEQIVDTWQDENTRISTEDAIALTTQVLLEFSPDEDAGGPAWVGRADLFEQMKKKGFNGSSSRFSQILTKMVEREAISRRPTREKGGREYRMRSDLWMMHRLLWENADKRHITPTPKAT
jgi:hypothetical protein